MGSNNLMYRIMGVELLSINKVIVIYLSMI
jgi:hypothetical protein